MNKEATNSNNYSWKFIIKITISIILGISALLGFLFGTNEFLDNKIIDNDYIYKLSKTLRPFCIFNRKGIIVYNHGAYKIYVDAIKVINQKSQQNKNDKRLDEIVIHTKEYLQIAPLLEYIGPNDIIIFKPERISSNEWLFNFIEIGYVSDVSQQKEYDEFFRLEILR